jgi:hypothetical protein
VKAYSLITLAVWASALPVLVLLMLEKNAKTAAGSCYKDIPGSQTGSFRAGNLGGGQVPVEMRLVGRMSRAQRALLFGFSPAHRASYGQSVPQSECFRVHSNII